MPTPKKAAILAELKADLEKSQAVYLTETIGLDVAAVYELRGKLLDAGTHMQVAKNTLINLAIQGSQAEGLSEFLSGPTAILFCGDDVISPAKIVKDFSKTHEFIELKAAFVDGRLYGKAQAQQFADLPSPDQIKTMAVSAIAGPLNGFFGVINGAISELVYTLQSYVDKLQEQGA